MAVPSSGYWCSDLQGCLKTVRQIAANGDFKSCYSKQPNLMSIVHRSDDIWQHAGGNKTVMFLKTTCHPLDLWVPDQDTNEQCSEIHNKGSLVRCPEKQ